MNKFMLTQPQGIQSQKNAKKTSKGIERKILGLNLKNMKKQESIHSSVMMSDRNSSMRNIADTTYNLSEVSESSFRFMSDSRLGKSSSLRKSQKLLPLRSSSKVKETREGKEINLQNILKEYYESNFIQSLISFTTKQWKEEEKKLFEEKRFEGLKNLITQKTHFINQLTEDFMNIEYEKYKQKQRKLMISTLFKQNTEVIKDYEGILSELLRKIPEQKILKQESQLQILQQKLLEMFDIKFITSNTKLKERYELFIDGFTTKKNNLIVGVATKLKSNVTFIVQMEKYLMSYQKELIKIRNQLQVAETEKKSLTDMLKKKVNFTPIEIDYMKLKKLKEDSKKQFFDDLDENFISFHQKQHTKNDKKISLLENQNLMLNSEIQELQEKLKKLEDELQYIRTSIPKKKDAETQVFLIGKKGALEQFSPLSKMGKFLQNVSTPFNFTQKITSSVINLMSIDKILYDYERIKHKKYLKSFQDFMLEWFVIRTGNKRTAQIFTKNFMFSIKQLKGRHKRFNIFSKLCGFNGFRKKNLQQDLEYIFFQTQLAWYYIIKLALIYRKKLNDNPTGYHLFPPIQCEQIFKIPLRKVYEIIDEFFESEEIEKPYDLHNRIDYYAINQISKYKSHDESFQKQQLQQIHILRQINFDIIAGFVIEYVANQKCMIVEKLLRSINLKQKQIGQVVGYSQFQAIYKRYYKEKRSKIQQVYSQICVVNQHDMLDIENTESIVKFILEDERGLRSSFQQLQSLKVLILSEKAQIKTEKRIQNVNSYENFRERYYYEFYDFFNSTNFLEEIYRVVKSMIKKKLKSLMKNQSEIEQFLIQKQAIVEEEEDAGEEKKEQESEDDEYSEGSASEAQEQSKKQGSDKEKRKLDLQGKVTEWNKISIRIPHFSQKILTVDQIIVHNMRRKEMVEATEFAWKTLRQILIIISKE